MNFSEKLYFKMKKDLDYRDVQGFIPHPDSSTPIEKEDGELFTFVVFGDPQISHFMPARESNLYSACLDIKNMKEKLDALVLVGDLAEFGMECEFRTLARMMNEISDKVSAFHFMPGNHDLRLRVFGNQLARFRDFAAHVSNAVVPPESHYYYSVDYPFCRFIILGSDSSTFEGTYISKKQLNWLDGELSKSDADGKPAFVFNHQALKYTNGLPNTWMTRDKYRGSVGIQNKAIEKVLKSHRKVFFVTGHLHQGIHPLSFEDYGEFKALSVPTVGAENHGEYGKPSQGYVISVFSDRIKIRARLFGEGKYVDPSKEGAYCEVEI